MAHGSYNERMHVYCVHHPNVPIESISHVHYVKPETCTNSLKYAIFSVRMNWFKYSLPHTMYENKQRYLIEKKMNSIESPVHESCSFYLKEFSSLTGWLQQLLYLCGLDVICSVYLSASIFGTPYATFYIFNHYSWHVPTHRVFVSSCAPKVGVFTI